MNHAACGVTLEGCSRFATQAQIYRNHQKQQWRLLLISCSLHTGFREFVQIIVKLLSFRCHAFHIIFQDIPARRSLLSIILRRTAAHASAKHKIDLVKKEKDATKGRQNSKQRPTHRNLKHR